MNRRKFVGSLSLGILALLFPWFTPRPKKKLYLDGGADTYISESVGYTGQQFLDTGYVYAPYRPMLKAKWSAELSPEEMAAASSYLKTGILFG